MIRICALLVRPRPKVKVSVNWKNMKFLVRALLNPRDYAAEVCVTIGIQEQGEE